MRYNNLIKIFIGLVVILSLIVVINSKKVKNIDDEFRLELSRQARLPSIGTNPSPKLKRLYRQTQSVYRTITHDGAKLYEEAKELHSKKGKIGRESAEKENRVITEKVKSYRQKITSKLQPLRNEADQIYKESVTRVHQLNHGIKSLLVKKSRDNLLFIEALKAFIERIMELPIRMICCVVYCEVTTVTSQPIEPDQSGGYVDNYQEYSDMDDE